LDPARTAGGWGCFCLCLLLCLLLCPVLSRQQEVVGEAAILPVQVELL
jgi:hypothetical protein